MHKFTFTLESFSITLGILINIGSITYLMGNIMTAAFDFVVNLITDLGYWGIYIGMFIESSSIPLPSEAIMGFAGYLVYKGDMHLWLAGLVGAIGNISGSTFMYFLGLKGGRPLVEKYGKYLHITEDKIEKSDKWFAKWGDEMVFIAQLLPGIRTFISLPAGIVKVNFPKFILYTFSGAFLWCVSLAYVAFRFGKNWEKLADYMHEFQIFVIAAVFLGILYLGYRYISSRNKPQTDA